ncbi:HEPN domain-containing protein [Lacinutrix salivirga]
MNKEYINIWLDLAMNDLKTSQVLYQNKLYSNSFYHFQQASEKSLKAYAFLSKIYSSEKEANQTGHYTLSVFKNSLENRLSDYTILKQLDFENVIGIKEFEEYGLGLNTSLDIIPKKKEVFEYSGSILETIFKTIDELKKYKFSLPDDFESIFKTKIDILLDTIYELNPSEIEKTKTEFNRILENKDEFAELKKNLEKILSEMLNENFHVLVIYFSNLISHNHNNISRYPEANFNPLKYYNLRRPIIKKLPRFSKNLYSTITQLKKWNKINPTSN